MTIELACERCGACCRGPGHVRLTDGEISQIARFKGLSEADFIQQFTRLQPERRGLSLIEKPDGSCVFLAGNACAIQPVKPQQCREFPGRWVNSLWGKASLAVIEEDYPMLANCAAFQGFVKTRGES